MQGPDIGEGDRQEESEVGRPETEVGRSPFLNRGVAPQRGDNALKFRVPFKFEKNEIITKWTIVLYFCTIVLF